MNSRTNIMRVIGVIVVWSMFTSCATTLTRKAYTLKIHSVTSGDKIEINNEVYTLPAAVKVTRAKTDLQIRLISDTIVKDYTVRPSPNPQFVFGNLLWMQVCPAAYLIDLTNQKRFYYGKTILVDRNDDVNVITPKVLKGFENYFSKTYPKQKGNINLVLSLPHINSFYLQPPGESSKSNVGFWGISMGLEYFYKDNRYVSLTANGVTDFFVPVPAAVDIYGEYELMTSTYLSLTSNHKINRFHFGYGINFALNNWDLSYHGGGDAPPPTHDPVTKSSHSFGVTLNAYHQLSKRFLIGVVYRPSILRISPTTEFKYEHVISLDFGWRIPLKK